jgi:transcription elongation factor GreA
MSDSKSKQSDPIQGEPAQGEPITAEGIAELRAEVEDLEGRARSEMAERIKAARELGDLKENADYHIAKDDQGLMEAKIKRLRQRLNSAVVVEVDSAADSFAFGRTAEVHDEANGEVHTWTLVGATEADPGEGRLSVESPVGRALLDSAVGATVEIDTPRGKKSYRVAKLVDPPG